MEKVGTIVSKTSKQGGGSYTIIGHTNCNRCKKINEEREVTEPSKLQKRNGTYYSQYSRCDGCGLFQPMEGTKIFIYTNLIKKYYG